MPSKKLLPLFALGLVLAAVLFLLLRPRPAPQARALPPVPVRVATATVRDLPLTFVGVGRVQASDSVTLRSRIDGQVATLPMREGEEVPAGTVLLTLDDAELRTRLQQAQAQLARDEAQLANARTELARNETLKEKNYVSDDMLRASRTNVLSLEASVKASRAAVENARLQLGYTVVRAPFAGRIGARQVSPGATVKANDTILAVLNRVHPVQVAFAVPDKFLGYLQPLHRGGRLPLAVSADNDPGLHLEGAADFIDNAVDAGSGTIQVKASFANRDNRLTPGAYVQVRLTLDTWKQVLVIPAAAVQQNGESSSVYVVTPDRHAALRPVQLRDLRDDLAVIAAGLQPGEQVISDGLLRLTPGARVQVQGAQP